MVERGQVIQTGSAGKLTPHGIGFDKKAKDRKERTEKLHNLPLRDGLF